MSLPSPKPVAAPMARPSSVSESEMEGSEVDPNGTGSSEGGEGPQFVCNYCDPVTIWDNPTGFKAHLRGHQEEIHHYECKLFLYDADFGGAGGRGRCRQLKNKEEVNSHFSRLHSGTVPDWNPKGNVIKKYNYQMEEKSRSGSVSKSRSPHPRQSGQEEAGFSGARNRDNPEEDEGQERSQRSDSGATHSGTLTSPGRAKPKKVQDLTKTSSQPGLADLMKAMKPLLKPVLKARDDLGEKLQKEKADHVAAKERIDELEKQLEEKESSFENERKAFAKKDQFLKNRLEAESVQANQKIKDLEAEMEKVNQKVKDFKTSSEKDAKERQKLVTEYNSIKQKLEEKDKKIMSLEEELQDRKTLMADLRRQMEGEQAAKRVSVKRILDLEKEHFSKHVKIEVEANSNDPDEAQET